MKVLITAGNVEGLSASAAGEAIARGWTDTDPSAQVAVVALAEAGQEFVQAVADLDSASVGLIERESVDALSHSEREVVALGVNGPNLCAVSIEGLRNDHSLSKRAGLTTAAWGHALAKILAGRSQPARTVLIDLSGNPGFDGGRGFLHALGAGGLTDATEEQGGVDLSPVRDSLGSTRLVGIAGRGDEGSALLGLRGVVSMAAHHEREMGKNPDPGSLLAWDSTLGALASQLGLASPAAGAGAGGGLGLAIQALGGEIMTGPQWLAEANGLVETVRQADLIVTSTSRYDFASRGGGVVQAVADWATAAMRPCIVLAGEVVIGGREQRTMGVESAYAVHQETVLGSVRPVSPEQLRALAGRVAHTWSW